MRKRFLRDRRGFTLVEVLVVILIIMILLIVVVSLLNPFELLRQTRDARRISDISLLNKTIGTYYSDAINNPSTLFMGTSSIIYISVPDPSATSTAGDQCNGLGLPTLTGGYTYHCAASSTYTRIDGTGWIPINFNNYSAGSLLSSLPFDPTNNTSTNLYYTYTTDGIGGYKIAAFLESQKNAPLMASDGGADAELYEKGTNPALSSGRGLVGYWPLTEGTGSIAYDNSENGATGTWNGSSTNGSYYTTGKVGPYSGNFNGTNDYVYALLSSTSTFSAIDPAFTISAWINIPSSANGTWMIINSGSQLGRFVACGVANSIEMSYKNASATPYATGCIYNIPTSTWNLFTSTYDGTTGKLYENGTLVSSVANGGILPSGGLASVYLGSGGAGYQNVNILMDDMRIYNYALPATEIQQMYNAEK